MKQLSVEVKISLNPWRKTLRKHYLIRADFLNLIFMLNGAVGHGLFDSYPID